MKQEAIMMPSFKNNRASKRSTRSALFGSSNDIRRIVAVAAGSACCILMAGSAFAESVDAPGSQSLPTEFSINSGATFWSGDFGAQTRTNISSYLVGGRWQIDGLRLTASIPHMDIRSDGSFFAGIGGTPLFVAPNIAPPKHRRSGWGDLTLGASYLIPQSEERGLGVEVSGQIKLATASSRSDLSTGKTDYAGGLEIFKTIGRITPSLDVEYRVFGDNQVWHLHNGFDVSAGAAFAPTDRTTIVFSYEYTQAPSRFIRDSHALVLGASAPIGHSRFRLNSYFSKGLSTGAADVSGGLSLTVKL